MKKKRGLLKKLIVLLVSCAICFAVIEVAARIFLGNDYPMNRDDAETVRMRFLCERFSSRLLQRSSERALCYELIPGGFASILDQVYTINGRGLRGPEITGDKPAGTVRVVVSGDSFVFGWGVDDHWTLASIMERILAENGCGAERFDVINSGVPGYNVAQMKEYLYRKSLPLDPDVLVLVVSANDIVSNYLHFNTLFEGLYEDRMPVPYLMKPFCWRVSVIYRYLAQRLKEVSGPGFTEEDVAFFGREVRDIERIARERGIRFLPVILPMLEPFDEYPYEKQHQDMHRVLEGVDYVDLLPRMGGYDVKTLWFRPDDHHLNERANLAVSRMILSVLNERGMVSLKEGALPEEPLAEALYESGDLIVVDLDADPEGRGDFPGAVFKVDPETGEVSVVSADPKFREPVDLVFDELGNLLVLDADAEPGGAVFRVNRFTGRAETVLTSDRFAHPNSLLLDGEGRIYISDKNSDPHGLGTDTGALLVYNPKTDAVEALACSEGFVAPGAIAFSPEKKIYFLDADSNPNGYLGRTGEKNTPGALFEVDRFSGEIKTLIEFKDTVSPVGLVVLPEGGLIVIDANADVLKPGYFLGGIGKADPKEGTFEFIHCSTKFIDPTRGDLGKDGFLYFADPNADPLKLGPDKAGKGVQGTGPGAIWRYDLKEDVLSLVVSDERFVNPTSLKVVP